MCLISTVEVMYSPVAASARDLFSSHHEKWALYRQQENLKIWTLSGHFSLDSHLDKDSNVSGLFGSWENP